MKVENYVQNLNDYSQFRNNGRGGCGIKRADGTLSRRAMARLIRDAHKFMDGFGLDWSQFDVSSVTFYDMQTAQVEWKHKVSGNEVHLTDIHFERKTGEIIQAGSNYGNLTL